LIIDDDIDDSKKKKNAEKEKKSVFFSFLSLSPLSSPVQNLSPHASKSRSPKLSLSKIALPTARGPPRENADAQASSAAPATAAPAALLLALRRTMGSVKEPEELRFSLLPNATG